MEIPQHCGRGVGHQATMKNCSLWLPLLNYRWERPHPPILSSPQQLLGASFLFLRTACYSENGGELHRGAKALGFPHLVPCDSFNPEPLTDLWIWPSLRTRLLPFPALFHLEAQNRCQKCTNSTQPFCGVKSCSLSYQDWLGALLIANCPTLGNGTSNY